MQAVRAPHPLVVAPTGSGKTTMGVFLARALADRGVVWIAHRTELIDQAAQRFADYGITAGVIQASRPATPGAPIQVASVQTLARRDTVDAGVYIIDEAHHAAANSYRQAIPDAALRIGLTATPFRTDGKGLGDMFDTLIQAATPCELVASGALIEPEVWIVRPPDMQGVTRRGGDYAQGETAKRANTSERRADIVAQWIQRCAEMRTIAFAASVDHSAAIATAFVAAGVPAEHVDADTPPADRAAAVARLAAGETLVLCNCRLFTEGFDLPAVEAIIDAAPTESLGLHMQKIGRVMRPADGKFRAIVNDHAGNHQRLGRVTQPISYSLDTDAAVSREPSEPLGLTVCGDCYRMYAGAECPECGAGREPGADHEIDGSAGMTQMTEHDTRAAYWSVVCEETGGGSWARAKFNEKYGEYPATYIDDGEHYFNPDTAGKHEKRMLYRTLLAVALDKGFKIGWASQQYREAAGCWPSGFVADVKRELGVEDQETQQIKELWA